MPESPRWLIARDCLDEAQTILESFGGKNEKTTVDSQALRSVIKKVREDQLARERKSKKYSLLDLLRSPKLRKWTSIICYQWYDCPLGVVSCCFSFTLKLKAFLSYTHIVLFVFSLLFLFLAPLSNYAYITLVYFYLLFSCYHYLLTFYLHCIPRLLLILTINNYSSSLNGL